MAAVLVISMGGGSSDGAVSERDRGKLRSLTADAVTVGPGIRRDSEGASSRSETCPDHRRGLAFYRQRHRYWLQMRGERRRIPSAVLGRSPRSCPDARYLAGVWRERAARARTTTERWIAQHVLRDFEVLPGNNAWRRAVREAQKPYPGTTGWLLSCSDSEGGWGRWVPNSQGSGVGGWLQFYPSTFSRMFSAAASDVASRGFIVPGSAGSWYSPLGQALAGAWGVTHGRRHEWHGQGC